MMKKNFSRMILRITAVIVPLLLIPSQAEAGSKLVADPARAVKNTWNKYPVCGKDFWYLLDPKWLTLKGIAHEEFVQKSGTGFVHQTVTGENVEVLRVLSIGEITCYDARGRKRKAEIRIIPEEKDTRIVDPQYINDEKAKSYCVLSGDILDLKRRYSSFKSVLKFKSSFPIAKLAIRHGIGGQNRIGKLIYNGKEVKIPAGKDTFQAAITPAAKEFELTIYSSPLKYTAKPLNHPYEARLKSAPFVITNTFRANYGNIFGLSDENVDQESFAAVRKKYGKNFLGYWMPEWDHNYILAVSRPNLAYYKDIAPFIKVPCHKDDFLKNVLKFCWDAHKPIFGKDLLGMSGQILFPHYSCDWGSTVSGMEMTQEKTEHAGRVTLMFTRGAARQFDKPMYVYQAYYGGSHSPNSTLRGLRRKLDWGVAPSLVLRNFFIGYYMGNNYLDFEAQVYGMVKMEKDGTHTLTANGRNLKEFYEWTAGSKGKRGECYAPILLLADRKHGYDMWYRIGPRYWRNFYNIYPLTDANYFMDYVMQVISPRYDYHKFDNPKFSPNLHNSTVGDIFDLYIANPLVHGEISLKQLKKYPVTALVDDITYTESMANTLKQYVAEGGTLLLTTGQTGPFEEDPDFLGVKIGKDQKKEDGLFIHPLTLLPGTEEVMKTSKKSPLVTKKKYGNGHVILLASPFMKKEDKKTLTQVPVQLVKLFEKIQSELLPVKVEGDCQYLFNIMPDGTWKVILINNRGIVKLPTESTETHHREFTSKVTLSVPSGVTVKELRKNAVPVVKKGKEFDQYSFAIAPADIYVVDMKGIKFESKIVKKDFKFNKVKNYTFKPYTPKIPNDGYRPRPASTTSTAAKAAKAPAIVASWKGENNMKESTGKGYELKFHNVEVKDGAAVYNTLRSWGILNFTVDYSLPTATYEFILKPAPYDKWHRYRKMVRGGILYKRNLMLEYYYGKWSLMLFDRTMYVRLMGPKAAPEWTHICVTTEKNIARLFVNGVEVKNGKGSLKSIRDFGLYAPRNKIAFNIGSLSHTWPTAYSFHGKIKEFTIHGRALSPEEIAGLAAKIKK